MCVVKITMNYGTEAHSIFLCVTKMQSTKIFASVTETVHSFDSEFTSTRVQSCVRGFADSKVFWRRHNRECVCVPTDKGGGIRNVQGKAWQTFVKGNASIHVFGTPAWTRSVRVQYNQQRGTINFLLRRLLQPSILTSYFHALPL